MTEYEKPRSIEEHQNECSNGVLMRMGDELRWGAARAGGQTRVGSSGGAPGRGGPVDVRMGDELRWGAGGRAVSVRSGCVWTHTRGLTRPDG
jgi:hypothetical protein